MPHYPCHRHSQRALTRCGVVPLLLTGLLGALAGCSSIGEHLVREQARMDAEAAARDAKAGKVATWPVSQPASKPASMDSLVSDNLVNVLVQVLAPMSTTIQTTTHADPLGQLLVARLGEAGYGIQRVETDLGAHLLRYERTSVSDDNPRLAQVSRLQYTLSIGDIEIARHYRVDAAGRVVPDSPVLLAGSRMAVQVDDSGFTGLAAAGTASSLTSVSYVAPVVAPVNVPTISLITPGIVKNVARSASKGPSYQALNSSQVEVSNRFYGNSQSFGGIARSHANVAATVVIFPNDSMRLGEQGKLMIRQLVEQYQERTDLISLVGCSNGYTALAIGNEGLALGRSRRVSEELMSLGIGRDHILDEGCWAPTSAGDRFPSRGVVIELLRRKPS